MAFTSATPQNPTKGAADFDLALTLYAGEVLAEFENKNVLMDLTRTKDLAPGAKAVQFLALGAIGNKYHTAGEDVFDDAGYMQTVAQGERLVYPDRENLSPIFLDKVEEVIGHWDARGEYAMKQGHGLAKTADQMIMRTLAIGAAESAGGSYTASPAGFTDTSAAADPTSGEIIAYLLDHQEYMDQTDVPEEDRYALLTPAMNRLLFASADVDKYIDRDYEATNGSLAKSEVIMIAGFKIKKITHMPTDNFLDTDNKIASGVGNSYVYNATKLKIISFQREAVGTAKSSDLSVEIDYHSTKRGSSVIAAMQMGHGVLRAECAGTLSGL